MAFDANVIKRQYGERPWSHFRLKPDDLSFDSTAGLQDILDSKENVPLPPATFYTDQLNFTAGSKLIGAGAFYKILTTQAEVSGSSTIIRYNGAGGANSCVVNMSDKATISTDASAGNMIGVYLRGVTIDANGNRIASGGGREVDGAATADIGIYMNRVGNLNTIAEQFTIIGATDCGLLAQAIYTGGMRDFGIMECLDMPCAIGYNYFAHTTAENVICHDMTVQRFDIRYCGDYGTTGGGGGGTPVGFSQVTHKHGAAMFIMGRNCDVGYFSFQRNGGMMVFGGASKAGTRNSEASTLHHGYFERNVAVTAGSGSPDTAYALFIPYADGDIMRKVHHCFFNGGNVSYPEQIVRIQNADYDNDGIENNWTAIASDSTYGPANPNEWISFEHCGSQSGLGGQLKIQSTTQWFHADYETSNGDTGYNFTSYKPYGRVREVRGFIQKKDVDTAATPLTISTGKVTVTGPGWYKIDTGGGAANLDGIDIGGGFTNAEAQGWVIMISQTDATRDVTLTHNTGDDGFLLNGLASINLNHPGSVITLMWDNTVGSPAGRWVHLGGGQLV